MRTTARIAALALCLVLGASHTTASTLSDSLRMEVGVGYTMGGTSPIPLPESIRSVDGFNLGFSPTVWAGATLGISPRWGVQAGFRVGRKMMDGEVTVQGYHMAFVQGTNSLEGYFTGHVNQQANLWVLTVPVQASIRLGKRWTLRAGPYASVVLHREFCGIASDGHLRQGTPTGPSIAIGNTEATWATYDFSDEVRPLQWGLSLAATWYPWRHVGFEACLEWGLSGLLHSDFRTVEQTLYPIFGTVGVVYGL